MSRQNERLIRAGHPELDAVDVQRTAEQYETVARETGSTVAQLVTESRQAEGSSRAGKPVTP